MLLWLQKHRGLVLWLLLSSLLSAYLYYLFYESDDKTALLPGLTTSGHHQIEMECSACHTDEAQENIFTSSGVPNSACIDCHGEDLSNHSDSHPVRKFKNPENAVFVQHIDALKCITCHTEHNEKITGEMAVSLPADYCAHCHDVTLRTLESHKNLKYDSCATSGCHNYHDNTALEPSFLLKHFGGQKHLPSPEILTKDTESCPDPWAASTTSHQCAECHETEMSDFQKGKHGMRLAFDNLSPMTPQLARIPMKKSAAHLQMDCRACHQPEHRDRPIFAAQESCLQCHDDEHTRNHQNSPHFNVGVTCATCHMPSENRDGTIITNHDNTANLRPNEKMIKNVCMDCHGLQFSMDAMSSSELFQSNFAVSPTSHHPGIQWSVEAKLRRGGQDAEELKELIKTLGHKFPPKESPPKSQ